MKIIRVLLFALSLSISVNTYACWDDDWDDDYSSWYDDSYDYSWDDYYDDWWNDDSDDDVVYGEIDQDNYDIDGGTFDDVICTPDDDYDWGIGDDPLTDVYDDSWNDEDNSWDDGWVNGGDENNPWYENNVNKYHKFNENDVVVKDKLPLKWPKQKYSMDCVPVAMEYVTNILLNDFDIEYRHSYKLIYFEEFKENVTLYGIGQGVDMDKFIDMIFEMSKVGIEADLQAAIEEHYCILATIENDVGLHEVVIVAYSLDNGDYTYIDPGTGTYKTCNYDFFIGDKYIIKGTK